MTFIEHEYGFEPLDNYLTDVEDVEDDEEAEDYPWWEEAADDARFEEDSWGDA